jgi:hypothetical protein
MASSYLVFAFVFGFLRFVSKQICLFQLFRNGSETPKQTKKIIFWFRETNRKWTETDCVSVCFGSNQKKIDCFEDTLTETIRTSEMLGIESRWSIELVETHNRWSFGTDGDLLQNCLHIETVGDLDSLEHRICWRHNVWNPFGQCRVGTKVQFFAVRRNRKVKFCGI